VTGSPTVAESRPVATSAPLRRHRAHYLFAACWAAGGGNKDRRARRAVMVKVELECRAVRHRRLLGVLRLRRAEIRVLHFQDVADRRARLPEC